MQLSELCVKKPVFTIVLSLIIITVGSIFFTKLELRDTPNITPPLITVTANYQGADAEYMERKITQPIEEELKSTKNMDSMISNSSAGRSNITIVLKLDSDIEVALSDVRSKISGLSQILPDDMTLPSVEKLDIDANPSMWITLGSSAHDDLELTKIANNQVLSILEKLPTIGSATIFGARDYTMLIEPSNKKMFQYQLSPLEIEKAVRAQNRDYPAGRIKTDTLNFSVKLFGSINNVKEFQDIIVKSEGGNIIKLGDVAKVSLQPSENDSYLRYNGKPSLAIGLVKQSTANIIELADSVRAELPNINKNLPSNVKLEIAYDGAVSVNASIKSVYVTIFESIILVGLVTYLFLGSLTITLIPVITIPISLIGTFTLMHQFGFTINSFTLLAMILAIGLVVDDAIVMMENIYRHVVELGKKPMIAAIDASKEISFAIIAMTITLASVFFPVGFIEGMLGKLFIEFAWTLAFCILFSGFVALTLTPMMCARMISAENNNKSKILVLFGDFMLHIQTSYLKLLDIALLNKNKFFAICAVSVVILVFSIIKIDKILVPEEDNGFLITLFRGPEGSSSLQSLETVKKAEEILSETPEIRGYFGIVGQNGGEEALAFLPLKDWSMRSRSQEDIKQELNYKFSQIPGMSIFVVSPPSIGGRRGDKEVEFYVTSSAEYKDLDLITQKFLDQLKAGSVLVDCERGFKASTPTLDVIVNRARAYRYSTQLDMIGNTIQYLIAGKIVGDFRIGSDIYDVILQYNIKDRNEANDLKSILIKNSKNQMIPLESVADIKETTTIKSYSRYNNNRAIKITANLANGQILDDAVLEIEKISANLAQNNNFQIYYDGQLKQLKESNNDTILVFIFALIFIFLVLSAQFESFGDSILILIVVPFSITGGVIALLILGNSLNMYSNIGLITLIGLVTKNSIMIVEFANQLRNEGMKASKAILEATKLRFRPILMTSTATICGALPLLFASGAGAAARGSIGIVIIGGMLMGTIFTMFIVPIIYHSVRRDR